MLRSDEIIRSSQGAWELFLNKENAMRFFDCSYRGFWRSFLVFFLLTPFFILSAYSEKSVILHEIPQLEASFPHGSYLAAQAIAYTMNWLLFPLLLAAFAGPLQVSQTYAPYIVARNWASLISALMFSIPAVLFLIGALPIGVMVLITLILIGVMLRYQYLIARTALQAPMSMAIALVILDFLLSLLIGEIAGRVAGL